MSVANDSRETSQLSALQEHIDCDHETLRALWNLAAEWDIEADAIESGAPPGDERRRRYVEVLRSCAAELRDVATGRQT